MKNAIITILVIVIVGFGAYYLINSMNSGPSRGANNGSTSATSTYGNSTSTFDNPYANNATSTDSEDSTKTVIGSSVEGNNIVAYHYGTGSTNVLFVGGIHGGYEWNTVLVAYQLMDYLQANPNAVPSNVRVTVIPVLNPDGLQKTVGTTGKFSASDVPSSMDKQIAGRFNGNNVDLNRNFDCDWQASGVWQNKKVSGGSSAFSEPESKAFRDYVDSLKPSSVVVWYSAAGGVYTSNCHAGVLPETKTLAGLFSKASGYKTYDDFNFYEVTGDAVNWLAKEGIPAISILLTDHQNTEWSKNLAGIQAILKYYSN